MQEVSRFNTQSTLLYQFAESIATGIMEGLVTGQPISLARIESLCGPRVGILEIYAGLETGRLLKVLKANNGALARQFVPWKFTHVYIYLNGKAIRIETPWPEELAFRNLIIGQKNRPSLPSGPKDSSRWFAGMSDTGAKVSVGFSHNTPHWLISGSTGSGKTWALRSAIWQLSRSQVTYTDPTTNKIFKRLPNQIVLLDGKMGQGLRICQHLPAVIGPLVTNREMGAVMSVLSWLVDTMEERYDHIADLEEAGARNGQEITDELIALIHGRIIFVIDEIQSLIEIEPDVVPLLRKLLAQGRAALVNGILATQQPTADVFTDRTIKPNLPGRIALRTTHAEASRAALGQSTPRSDWLLGGGDAYCLSSHATVQRVQMGYVPVSVFPKTSKNKMFETWPHTPHASSTSFQNFDQVQVAMGIKSVMQKWTRARLWAELIAMKAHKPSKSRTRKLLTLCREIHQIIKD